MEGFGVSGNSFAKKRTARLRRLDLQFTLEARARDASPPSSTPSSDNASKLSPAGPDVSFWRKEFNVNSSAPRIASINKIEGLAARKKLKKDDEKFGDLEGLYRDGSSKGGLSGNSNHRRSGSELKRCSEDALAPANWKGASKVTDNSKIPSRSTGSNAGKSGDDRNNVGQSIGTANGSADNKLKKVKLTVGGVTRTIHAKSNLSNEKSGSSSAKPSCSSDASRRRLKLILQDTSDDDYPPPEKGNGLQGARQKDFGGGVISYGAKDNSGAKAGEESLSGKQMDLPRGKPFSDPVCESKRAPKRRALDGESDDGNEDDEIGYLERLKTSKVSPDYSGEHEDDGEEDVKNEKVYKVYKSRKSAYHVNEDYGLSRSNKDSKRKSRAVRESDDRDYVGDEEPGSGDGPDGKGKKHKKEPVDSSMVARSEPLTTRQRVRQLGKGAGESLIEFPDGLPASTPRKQKKQLSEEEQHARKAEAAQRRRMQVEKAARESEAEAIRKILGQDSNRKKKEEKIRKEREEMALKAAESLTLASNSIRWVMGPSGTVVTFGDDVVIHLRERNVPPHHVQMHTNTGIPNRIFHCAVCNATKQLKNALSLYQHVDVFLIHAFFGLRRSGYSCAVEVKTEVDAFGRVETAVEAAILEASLRSAGKVDEHKGPLKKVPADEVKNKSSAVSEVSSRNLDERYNYLKYPDAISHMSSNFSSEERLPDAASEKELGNEYFKQKKFLEAIECYSRSIALSPTSVAFANRAMAYLKLKRQGLLDFHLVIFEEAENDCTEALNLDDRYVKAYSRRATARKELGKLIASMEDSEFAMRLEPNNQELRKQYTETKALYEKGSKGKTQDQPLIGVKDTDSRSTEKQIREHLLDESREGAGQSSNNAITKKDQVVGRKRELKASMQDLASRAASRVMATAGKSITAPKTAYEFEVSWRALSDDYALQTQLLKTIPPATLPHIFKNALSSPILMDIIKCTTTFFKEDPELAVSILDNLAKVPRFDMIVMCLSAMDRSGKGAILVGFGFSCVLGCGWAYFAISLLNVIIELLDSKQQVSVQILGCQTFTKFIYSQIWFMTEYSCIFTDFDEVGVFAGVKLLDDYLIHDSYFFSLGNFLVHIIHAILENYRADDHIHIDDERCDSNHNWVDEVVRSESRAGVTVGNGVDLSHASFRPHSVARNSAMLTREEHDSPEAWSQICVQKLVEMAQESTTMRHVLDPMFYYFDTGKHWDPRHGLALLVLSDMTCSEKSSGNEQLILSAIIRHLDHKNVVRDPKTKSDIVQIATILVRQLRSQAVVAEIGSVNDLCRHLRKSLQATVESAGPEESNWNYSLQNAIEDCLLEIVKGVFPEELLLQLMKAMMHPDVETRIGAHQIFSVTLIRSANHPRHESEYLYETKKWQSRTTSVFASATALLQKLRREKGCLNADKDGNDAHTEIKEKSMGDEELKHGWARKGSPYFYKLSCSIIDRIAATTCSMEEGTDFMVLTEDQTAQLLSAFWIQANQADNLPSNFEAIGHSFSLTLLFSRLKNSNQSNTVRFFQLPLSLRIVSLEPDGMLPPSCQRLLFTLATGMLAFAGKIYHISELTNSLKVYISSDIDPYLRIGEDLQIYVKSQSDLNVFGSDIDRQAAMLTLADLRKTVGSSDLHLLDIIIRDLSKITDLEKDVLAKQLTETFIPEDVPLFGSNPVLEQINAQALAVSEESLSFDEECSRSSSIEDDIVSELPAMVIHKFIPKIPTSPTSPNIISVGQLLESALHVAGQVAGTCVSTSPLPYGTMAGQCEALGVGTRKKLSSWLVGGYDLIPDNLEQIFPIGEQSAIPTANAYSFEQQALVPVEPRSALRLPPASPFDNFLKAAGF
ncbi:putative protein EFR [Cocos nucifera]|uniref:INO80 complex subunit B-like conserved region domain-containing protein n=1 Tax=Cocos nucifera TaxID=13894 RepID=A0A8K0NDK2_COCNU|nr:putative protein EFR [Cocos nucifera]